MSGYAGRWKLCARDIEVLEEVKDFVMHLRSKCERGRDLMAVGAAVQIIETILEGEMPEGFVSFSITGVERDEEDAGEVDLTLDVGWDEIKLGGMVFWDFGAGQDHESSWSASLTTDGGFNVEAARTWIRRANRIGIDELRIDWDGPDA